MTDWRDYDSIYTERYMLTLLHGTNDDNVHLQNTIQFIYELQKAGKQFELMVYPKSRHGVTEPLLNKHLHQLMLDFVMRNVK